MPKNLKDLKEADNIVFVSDAFHEGEMKIRLIRIPYKVIRPYAPDSDQELLIKYPAST